MGSLPRIEEALARTLADRRLSRGERSALRELLSELRPSTQQLGVLRDSVFARARAELDGVRDAPVLLWCEAVVELLASVESELMREGAGAVSEALFSPGDACVLRIRGLVSGARRTVDICVFTITDDRIAEAILATHRRGVAVRIVSDLAKSDDRGSDIDRLAREGIPVAVDRSETHMHHKFAIFDGSTVVTGSFNWTRSAADENAENIVVSDDVRLVRAFQGEFDRLWQRFAREPG